MKEFTFDHEKDERWEDIEAFMLKNSLIMIYIDAVRKNGVTSAKTISDSLMPLINNVLHEIEEDCYIDKDEFHMGETVSKYVETVNEMVESTLKVKKALRDNRNKL